MAKDLRNSIEVRKNRKRYTSIVFHRQPRPKPPSSAKSTAPSGRWLNVRPKAAAVNRQFAAIFSNNSAKTQSTAPLGKRWRLPRA